MWSADPGARPWRVAARVSARAATPRRDGHSHRLAIRMSVSRASGRLRARARTPGWGPTGGPVTDVPEVLLGDAGDWHQQQMERIVDRGIQVLIPPDAKSRKGTRPGWDGGHYAFMRRVLASERGGERYGQRQAIIEPHVRQHQVQPRHRSLQTPRTGRGPGRMAADHRHPQPPQDPPTRHSRRLKGRRRPQSPHRPKTHPPQSAVTATAPTAHVRDSLASLRQPAHLRLRT